MSRFEERGFNSLKVVSIAVFINSLFHAYLSWWSKELKQLPFTESSYCIINLCPYGRAGTLTFRGKSSQPRINLHWNISRVQMMFGTRDLVFRSLFEGTNADLFSFTSCLVIQTFCSQRPKIVCEIKISLSWFLVKCLMRSQLSFFGILCVNDDHSLIPSILPYQQDLWGIETRPLPMLGGKGFGTRISR